MSEWSGTSKRDIPVTVNRNGIVTDGPCFTHPSPDPVVSEAELEAALRAYFATPDIQSVREAMRLALTAALKVRTGK